MKIPLLDLKRQTQALRPAFGRAIERVFASGAFILGPEVERFEQEFARFCGTRYAIGVASGTDALELSLRVLGVGPGDRVATVSFTFLATVDAVLHVGAEPLFIDIEPGLFTMDPVDLKRKLAALGSAARRRVKAIVPVHLYGQPCRMDAIGAVARRYGIPIVEDAAQAAGARWNGRSVGRLGDLGAFSFFPSKNLGALGDGGAVTTNSRSAAEKLKSLRMHGRNARGQQVMLGRNSRLDELQAALLRVKLRRLNDWVCKRRWLAAEYNRHLAGLEGLGCPSTAAGAAHAFQLYTVRTPHREALARALAGRGIASRAYYSTPVHREPLHRARYRAVRLPQTEAAAREVLSLPLFPEMTPAEHAHVCNAVTAFYRR